MLFTYDGWNGVTYFGGEIKRGGRSVLFSIPGAEIIAAVVILVGVVVFQNAIAPAFLAATAYQPAPCNRLLDKTWRSPGNGLVFPPGQADLPQQPAVCVNWNDVQAYIAWLDENGLAARLRRFVRQAGMIPAR